METLEKERVKEQTSVRQLSMGDRRHIYILWIVGVSELSHTYPYIRDSEKACYSVIYVSPEVQGHDIPYRQYDGIREPVPLAAARPRRPIYLPEPKGDDGTQAPIHVSIRGNMGRMEADGIQMFTGLILQYR